MSQWVRWQGSENDQRRTKRSFDWRSIHGRNPGAKSETRSIIIWSFSLISYLIHSLTHLFLLKVKTRPYMIRATRIFIDKQGPVRGDRSFPSRDHSLP